MAVWLYKNLSTIVVGGILLLIVSAIVVQIIKDKKQGKSACGNKCAHCAMAGRCHSSHNKNMQQKGQNENDSINSKD